MRNDYIAMLGLREERSHHKEGGSVSRGKELAHMNKQEMRDYADMLGIKDETSKHRRLAEEGRGGDTRIGEMSHGAARRMDQEIHHGHKRVNPRTGLREYAPCGACENNIVAHTYIPGECQYANTQAARDNLALWRNQNHQNHQLYMNWLNFCKIRHSGKVQKYGDCAAHAALAHVHAANRMGYYNTPERYNKIITKPTGIAGWNLSKKSTINRYIHELNKRPIFIPKYVEILDKLNKKNLSQEDKIALIPLNPIDRQNANLAQYLTRDGYEYGKYIPSNRTDEYKQEIHDIKGKLKNAKDAIHNGHGVSVGTASKPDKFYLNNPEEKDGFHIVNVADAKLYNSEDWANEAKSAGLENWVNKPIIGEILIHDSNHYKPTKGYVDDDGKVYAKDYTEKHKKSGTSPRFELLYDLNKNRTWYDIDYSSRQQN